MKIAIFGMGYVGLTAAGCLTKDGHTVIGVDVSKEKVEQINRGETPISEPGLDLLIKDAVRGNLLYAVRDIGEKINECDMAFVCVGTPSAPDGSHNMSYIIEVTRQIASAVQTSRASPLTVVYRSTIRPGTLEELVYPVFKTVLKDRIDEVIELVYNPEFLRESVAIKDYFSPPKIVIGTKDAGRSKNMDEINKNISAPVFYTKFREAEFTKFVDNTFHALKVAFANEVGRVCVSLGISAAKVHEIFVADTKLNISPYYLRPGGAFGGSCLPKDVRALQYISSDVGMSTHVIDSLIRSNEAHKHFIFEYCTRNLKSSATILMVGLAFKADSDDLRESPNLDLARKILKAGHDLRIYDPTLSAAKLVGQNLGYGVSHLPTLSSLLIDVGAINLDDFDLIIDTNGTSGKINAPGEKVIRVDAI